MFQRKLNFKVAGSQLTRHPDAKLILKCYIIQSYSDTNLSVFLENAAGVKEEHLWHELQTSESHPFCQGLDCTREKELTRL